MNCSPHRLTNSQFRIRILGLVIREMMVSSSLKDSFLHVFSRQNYFSTLALTSQSLVSIYTVFKLNMHESKTLIRASKMHF